MATVLPLQGFDELTETITQAELQKDADKFPRRWQEPWMDELQWSKVKD